MRDDTAFLGYELFQKFVRGDAMIGLIADVPATERAMLDSLWAEAARANASAYRVLGDCYLAHLRPLGAFEGIAPNDAAARPWSAEAAAIVDDDNDALQAAMRAYREAARLGDRAALVQLAKLSRSSSEANQRHALALLMSLPDPSADELYLCGLVHNWISELERSAELHQRAAELGSSDAKFELYVLYAQGLGVTADPDASAAWLARAAADEHPRALYNVGAEHASGARGEPDMDEAAKYYRRAAQVGNGRAAATLAVMILAGDIAGTRAQAIEWLSRADELGFDTWQMLDAVGLDDPRDQDLDE
jgi:TPR repeat protein